MKCCFESFEETSSEDGVVGIRHIYYIKSYVHGAGIG
jgi:hypothetical protein